MSSGRYPSQLPFLVLEKLTIAINQLKNAGNKLFQLHPQPSNTDRYRNLQEKLQATHPPLESGNEFIALIKEMNTFKETANSSYARIKQLVSDALKEYEYISLAVRKDILEKKMRKTELEHERVFLQELLKALNEVNPLAAIQTLQQLLHDIPPELTEGVDKLGNERGPKLLNQFITYVVHKANQAALPLAEKFAHVIDTIIAGVKPELVTLHALERAKAFLILGEQSINLHTLPLVEAKEQIYADGDFIREQLFRNAIKGNIDALLQAWSQEKWGTPDVVAIQTLIRDIAKLSENKLISAPIADLIYELTFAADQTNKFDILTASIKILSDALTFANSRNPSTPYCAMLKELEAKLILLKSNEHVQAWVFPSSASRPAQYTNILDRHNIPEPPPARGSHYRQYDGVLEVKNIQSLIEDLCSHFKDIYAEDDDAIMDLGKIQSDNCNVLEKKDALSLLNKLLGYFPADLSAEDAETTALREKKAIVEQLFLHAAANHIDWQNAPGQNNGADDSQSSDEEENDDKTTARQYRIKINQTLDELNADLEETNRYCERAMRAIEKIERNQAILAAREQGIAETQLSPDNNTSNTSEFLTRFNHALSTPLESWPHTQASSAVLLQPTDLNDEDQQNANHRPT